MRLLVLLTLLSSMAPALAQEAPDGAHNEAGVLTPIPFVDATAPRLEDSIRLIPAGSLILLPPETSEDEPFQFSVPRKSFLLPEGHYDTALIKAKQLDICKVGLDTCTAESLGWQTRTANALTTCSDQFDSDEQLAHDLTDQVRTLETRALVAEDRLKVARKNQAVAWAITGGLVLGATSVIVASLVP